MLGDRTDSSPEGTGSTTAKTSGRRRITPEQDTARRELYEAGLPDDLIAERLGVPKYSIKWWRRSRNLPSHLPPGRSIKANPNVVPATPALKRRACALLQRNVSPTVIARELRCCIDTLTYWRRAILREHPELRRQGRQTRIGRHPNGKPYSLLSADISPRALMLYADGLDDYSIGRDLGVSRSRVWQWRRGMNLPAWRLRGRKASDGRRNLIARSKRLPPAITPRSNPLYARLADAIGRSLAPDLTDDAISDLWIAVAEGRVTLDRLAQGARRIRGRLFDTYANPRGHRSLDEDIGDGEGFRMIDLIRDERSSSWLERSGATVW